MDLVISSIAKTKERYLDGDSGVTIMSFFDKNTDNMMGLFQACVDRVFEISKK